ncbi:MAG: hypothetical protein R3234_08555, partial [Thermoanaerobaculia bacterium]|nr:hypothetical protein [Thermoanaerobaculia bacterium]
KGRDAAEKIVRSAESPELQDLGASARDCLAEAEPELRAIHETLSIAQSTDGDVPAAELREARDQLRRQLGWVSSDLETLRALYPRLSREDQRLARDLRQPLETLRVELERAAHLLDALLVEHPPDPF